MTTKSITATKLRNNLASALEAVTDKDILVVTRRGKKERVIVDIDKFEDLLAASNPKYLDSIAEARAEYNKGETLTFEEVFGDV